MKERAVTDRGKNLRKFSVLSVGMIEARRHRNGSAHVLHGVNRALIQAQRVTPYVAGKDRRRKCASQCIEGRAVAAAGAQCRTADRQFKRGYCRAQPIGGSCVDRHTSLASCRDQQFLQHFQRELAMRRHMSRKSTPNRYRQSDLQFDRCIGFFKHEKTFTTAGKILDQSPGQRVGGGDFQDRNRSAKSRECSRSLR